MKKLLFPGSFDPFTIGHLNLVTRALQLFDKVVVAVGVNSDKQYMFSTEERMQRVREMVGDNPDVEVVSYSGMTVDCCREVGAIGILRGVRNTKDMEYEETVAAVNRTLAPDLETVILFADTAYKDISSTLERERLLHSSSPQA